ncbi:hypothetical protein HPB52_016979 [Rhipicephalus sanguineus]|uniref:Uncharacterized protein n=1 Tax=Rhipicephalus sanguineus TaxID=34632 RepID=A0A9D4PX63_RHISA|nr:hypothetical protein HPB52_016979 [Rhipicephalus sanguineus]
MRNPEQTSFSEVFSSLMVPEPGVKETLGGGGVAAISPSRTDIHVTVMFNGIFSPTDARDVVVKLSLLAGKLTEPTVVASSEITLPKIHVLTLPPEQQPLLVAGKLSMRLTSPDGRRHIEGPVIVRPTCNIFQAVLTAETSNSGFAVLNVNHDGSISYQAYASGMNSAPMVVVLETDSPADNEVRTMAASYNPPFAYHWRSSYVENQRRDFFAWSRASAMLAGIADNMPLPLVLGVALLSRENAGPLATLR